MYNKCIIYTWTINPVVVRVCHLRCLKLNGSFIIHGVDVLKYYKPLCNIEMLLLRSIEQLMDLPEVNE